MIKNILNEIASESSTNKKMDILKNYKDNEILKAVLYLAESKRVKFYIKQIPEYAENTGELSLKNALTELYQIYKRNVTGKDASNFLSNLLSKVSEDNAYVIERIIEKDVKIGMGSTNINKILGKNFIEKTPYMGAVAFKESIAKDILTASNGAVSDVKMDGRYCNALIDGGTIRLESRGGEPSYLEGSKFLNELKEFNDNIVLNGELTMDNVTRYESNGIIASCISIGKKRTEGKDIDKELIKFKKKHKMSLQDALDSIVFTVWDCITPDEYADNKSDTVYSVRLNTLHKLISTYNPVMIRLVESKQVNSYSEAVEHFLECLNRGEEGTILKSLNGAWKDGKPKWQCKMKLEMDLDMEIIGFNLGTPGSKNENLISSVTVQSSDGIVKTSPAGMSEDDMEYVTANQQELLSKIIKVKCSGLSENSKGSKSLLHPVFIEIRDDKSVADSYDDMLQIENMKKKLS